MTEEDGEHLRAHLMLRTEEPLTGIYVWLDFDCEALVLRECAPGELMYVSGCAVYLDTVETKRGCAVEACVLEGAYLIGRGEVVELTFARLEKGPRPLIRQVVFYGPEEEMLRDGKSMIGPEPTPTGAESGVETTSWASVKALYR